MVLLFINLEAGLGYVVIAMHRPLSAPVVQETGRAPGPVSVGADNLAPTGVRTLNRVVSRFTEP